VRFIEIDRSLASPAFVVGGGFFWGGGAVCFLPIDPHHGICRPCSRHVLLPSCAADQGQFASASDDHTVRVWSATAPSGNTDAGGKEEGAVRGDEIVAEAPGLAHVVTSV